MTDEDKKIVANYMGWWSTWEAHDGSSSYFIPAVKPKIYFDLNDAGLVVQEMQKRGDWEQFHDFVIEWGDLLSKASFAYITAWLFNSENFFKAFVEWRKIILKEKVEIPHLNHHTLLR